MTSKAVSQVTSVCRRWSILTVLLLATSKIEVTAHRRSFPNSDSILEIINPQEVERLIAERRHNATRPDHRFLAQNDLDDDFQDANTQTLTYDGSEPAEFEKHKNKESKIGVDFLSRLKNESATSFKMLKSNKNALYITKKEYLKKEYCKTESLMQKVKEEGCLSKNFVNKYCYGQCNSFYIPKNPRRRRTRPPLAQRDEREDIDQNGASFKYCAFCKPSKFTWITVTLRCPSLTPPYRKKRVQRIKQCKCLSSDAN